MVPGPDSLCIIIQFLLYLLHFLTVICILHFLPKTSPWFVVLRKSDSHSKKKTARSPLIAKLNVPKLINEVVQPLGFAKKKSSSVPLLSSQDIFFPLHQQFFTLLSLFLNSFVLSKIAKNFE